jgi:regulator of replication initiation timing
MGHPLIDEFCRAHDFRPDFLRRCQRVFRDEINPLLEEREQLLVENAHLKAQLDAGPPKRTPKPVEAA